MPDPTTPAKNLIQPTVGGDNNTWGNYLNTDLALIDTALGGTVSISISGSTVLNTTQVENTGYIFTGTLSAAAVITFPTFYGFAVLFNNTAGNQAFSCGISGGTFVNVLAGQVTTIWSDGANFHPVSGQARIQLASSLNYYVNASTGSDGHSGLSPSAPLQTITKALQLLESTYDLNGNPVYISLTERAGTYDFVSMSGPVAGSPGFGVQIIGSPNRTITNATNATPIVITTSAAHGFQNGDHVVTHGVFGNTAANGAFVLAGVTSTTFQLTKEIDGSNVAGNGTYSSGGIVCSPLLCPVPGVKCTNGAQLSIGGISVSNPNGVAVEAILDAQITTSGPIDFAGAGDIGLYGSRGGYIEITYNFSVGGDFGQNFAQSSHRGEVRKAAAQGYFRASINCGPSQAFIYNDYGDYVDTGSFDPSLNITGASDTNPIVITIPNHPYQNRDNVTIIGVLGNTAANGGWSVSSVTTNTFTISAAGNGTYTGGGTCERTVRGVQGATNATPIVLDIPKHGFVNGDFVMVEGVAGNTGANGAWAASVIDVNHIALATPYGVNSVGNGAYTSGTGIVVGQGISWNFQGFLVPRTGTMQQYQQTQFSNNQCHGVSPPANYQYPGNATGITTTFSAGTLGPNLQLYPTGGFIIFADRDGGVLVQSFDNTLQLMSLDPTGNLIAAGSIMGASGGIGITPVSSSFLRVAQGTTTKSQMNLPAGAAPASPQDGDIWYDGTNLFFHQGGTTHTVNWT